MFVYIMQICFGSGEIYKTLISKPEEKRQELGVDGKKKFGWNFQKWGKMLLTTFERLRI